MLLIYAVRSIFVKKTRWYWCLFVLMFCQNQICCHRVVVASIVERVEFLCKNTMNDISSRQLKFKRNNFQLTDPFPFLRDVE